MLLRLDEIAEVTAGNPAPQDQSDFSNDGELFVRMQDVGRFRHTRALGSSTDRVTLAAIKKHRLRKYPVGTLLIPKSGASINLNHRALLSVDAYVVSHLATIIPDRTKVDPDYLYYWSLTYDPRHQAQVTSLPSLPTSLIKAATVPVPPLTEQCRIVDLLSRAENIVRMRREAEAKAKEIIPALFLDMFGDPATNPKGWETKTLGNLVVNLDGARKPVKSSDRAEMTGEIPYYGASGIIDYVSGHTHDVNALLVAEDGANLISRSTPIAFQASGKYWVNNHAHVLGQSRAADLTYLEVNLNLKDLRDSITGSAQPKLTQAALFKLPVMLPPIRNQEGFARHVSNVRLVSAYQSESMRKAEGAFQSLLAGVFGG